MNTACLVGNHICWTRHWTKQRITPSGNVCLVMCGALNLGALLSINVEQIPLAYMSPVSRYAPKARFAFPYRLFASSADYITGSLTLLQLLWSSKWKISWTDFQPVQGEIKIELIEIFIFFIHSLLNPLLTVSSFSTRWFTWLLMFQQISGYFLPLITPPMTVKGFSSCRHGPGVRIFTSSVCKSSFSCRKKSF